MAMLSLVLLLVWIPLCVAVGLYAKNHRGRSMTDWMVVSLLLSPLVGFVLVAALAPRIAQRPPREARPSRPEEFEAQAFYKTPFQIRSATGQHRRHGGVSGGGKGRGQGL